MPNAIVRAAATGLPSVFFNRRRMLLGLAAASTAAAGTVAVAAGKTAAAEIGELLDLGAKTAFVLSDYRKAVEARKSVVMEWSPQWPAVPQSIVHKNSGARRSPTLEDDDPVGEGAWIWRREKLLENIAYFAEPAAWGKRVSAAKVAREEAWRLKVKAERETILATLDAFDAKCGALVSASGIRSAQRAEYAARDVLMAHVRAVMALEPATMAGVLVQAETLEAAAHVPQIARVAWHGNTVRFHEGYGERLAASILRIAGQA